MSSTHRVTLQGLTVYWVCAQQCANKTYVWSMTGLLVRLANKLGLHQESAHLRLSIFVSEMRRHLWWQICTLDIRRAVDKGL